MKRRNFLQSIGAASVPVVAPVLALDLDRVDPPELFLFRTMAEWWPPDGTPWLQLYREQWTMSWFDGKDVRTVLELLPGGSYRPAAQYYVHMRISQQGRDHMFEELTSDAHYDYVERHLLKDPASSNIQIWRAYQLDLRVFFPND